MKPMKMRKKMPFAKMWSKELSKDFGQVQAHELMTRIQHKYIELCSNDKRTFPKWVLKRHLYKNIFPQMAAYRTFLENDQSQESAFNKTQKLYFLTLDKLKKQYKFFSRLPFSFPYIRMVAPFKLKFQHPPEGWNLEWVESSKDCINLKVHSCFYHDIIKEYGVPELTLIYCNGDDYVYE